MRRIGMKKYQVKAVVTGDLNMLRSFAGTGVPTITAISDPKDCILNSRYTMESCLIPDVEADEVAVVESLVRLAGSCDEKPVLFYGADPLMLLVSRNREKLLPHFRFNMPSPDIMEVCADKVRFGAHARSYGLPVPGEIAVRGRETLAGLSDRLSFPCILKSDYHIPFEQVPAKVIKAENRAELDAAVRHITRHTDNFTVQEYVAGGEEAVHSYHAYISLQGGIAAEYCGRKIRTYPSFAGISTYVELIHSEELLGLGREAVRKFGITGPVKIDFKKDASHGRFYLLEINLRFNLWNYLGARAGINLPLQAYFDCCGLSFPRVSSYRTDMAWLSFGNDLRGFMRSYRPEGRLTTLRWLRSFLRPKVYDIFAWSDPLPALVHGTRYAATAFRQLAGRASCVMP